jgi:uncharacterized protein
VIAVVTNILVYAHREESPWHKPAVAALVELTRGAGAWVIPWPCIHELCALARTSNAYFFSVVTHPRIYAPPTPQAAAIDQIDAWLESPTLVLLAESGSHWAVLRNLVRAGRVVGPRVHDARIAALCLQHGVTELWSADRDFQRQARLKVVNPLLA